MRVQIIEPRPIPEGWTYKRCDRWDEAEFKEMYKDGDGKVSKGCLEYIAANPKEYYTVADKLEIRQIAKQREVGSLYEITGYKTTKRYSYDHDGWKY